LLFSNSSRKPLLWQALAAALSSDRWNDLPVNVSRGLTGFAMVLVSACRSHAVVLPTRGHVYYESVSAGVVSLVPASKVLVLVERVNVCDRSKWLLGEASTTGIDAYLVRSDTAGLFEVSAKTFDQVCSRVVLTANAFAPGYASWSGRVVLQSPAPAVRSVLSRINENDVLLAPRTVTETNLRQVVGELHDLQTSYTVTAAMSRAMVQELTPEFTSLGNWPAVCKEFGMCGPSAAP
jgi:hypothetical protein